MLETTFETNRTNQERDRKYFVFQSGRVIIVRSEMQEFLERNAWKTENRNVTENRIRGKSVRPGASRHLRLWNWNAKRRLFFWEWTTEWTTPSIDLYLPSGIEIALTDVNGRKPETSREKSVSNRGGPRERASTKFVKLHDITGYLCITKQSNRIE